MNLLDDTIAQSAPETPTPPHFMERVMLRIDAYLERQKFYACVRLSVSLLCSVALFFFVLPTFLLDIVSLDTTSFFLMFISDPGLLLTEEGIRAFADSVPLLSVSMLIFSIVCSVSLAHLSIQSLRSLLPSHLSYAV